jgi:hypothetical protein
MEVGSRAESLRKRVRDAALGAVVSGDGNVVEASSAGDPRSMCAFAARSTPPIAEIGTLLGLGELRGWMMASGQETLFVWRCEEGLNLVSAPTTQAPEVTLNRLITSGD